jgi:hypothetical protein
VSGARSLGPDTVRQLCPGSRRHGYGLLHSRSQDTPTQDYYDCWDIMSDRTCVYSFSSQTFGFGGPGLNAFSVAALGWLGSDRIQGLTRAQISNTANLVLAALNNPGTSGPRMITVPLADDNPNHYYTIEFRQARGWDREIKGQRSPHRHSSVLIHEIRPDGYSDLVTTQGGADRLPGPHAFHDPANNVAIRVTNLDEVIGVASIVVSNDYNEPPGPPPPTRCNQVAGNVAGFICDMSSYTVTLERQQTDQSWLTVNVDNAPRYTYPQVDDPAPPHGVDTYQICNRDSTGSEGCTAPIVLTNPVSFGSLGGGWR